jgi:hypothetical protein
MQGKFVERKKSLATIQAQELGVFLGRAIINPGQI